MGRQITRQQPLPASERVSRQLSRMPVSNTGPELRLRSALHARGVRFRLRSQLPGRPDIILPGTRIAVFVDGCYWHACPTHGVTPKHNHDWWAQKLARNVERDRRKDAELAELGWIVIHVWEHEEADAAAEVIQELQRRRLADTAWKHESTRTAAQPNPRRER